LIGGVDGISVLPDGKILVGGYLGQPWFTSSPFVARLEADGAYDETFGEGGLVRPKFGCPSKSVAALRREGCLPRASATVRLDDSGPKPSVSIHLVAKPGWAGITKTRLKLPAELETTGYLGRKRARVVGFEHGEADVRRRGEAEEVHGQILISELGTRSVKVWVGNGALRFVPDRGRRGHKQVFHLSVGLAGGTWGGRQELNVPVAPGSKP
jgi:hypothetical protein